MDVSAYFRRLVRAALSGDPERTTPHLDFLGHYSARVVACASDGSTVDVDPVDARLKGVVGQGVRVVVGLPGASAVVAAGAIVWIGWEGGDPSKPRAIPSWESATVTKIILKATMVVLGDETGAEALVRKSDFDGHTHGPGSFATPAAGGGGGAVAGLSGGAAAAAGTAQLKAK